MIRFNNDYSQGAHPEVLAALNAENGNRFDAYGTDRLCSEAADLIREAVCAPDAAVHFAVGGTQANVIILSSVLRTFESVLSPDTGHIHRHETGALEHLGHKIELLPHTDGKITAKQVETAAKAFRDSTIPEHITEPKAVYISFPTEYGTLYAKKELEELSAVCREYGLYLFVDGARMAYGLASETNDLTLADFARLADAFTIGGTKCGALFGEAVVLIHPAFKDRFRSMLKQNGAMIAKGWLSGLQFKALFRNGLYERIGKHACALASRIRKAFLDAGIELMPDSPTNQLFVRLHANEAELLAKRFQFEDEAVLPDGDVVVRFCTSWYTEESDAEALLSALRDLPPRA
ncbi:MAG: aminotransferase class I/II-fold pyridoxal phosphate-dependent enzyme [Clostridia bacterium]|nr:aminotransferase class I/II-fold pyridoxal phosphate-dependent enzyme [Clostridia bacterium]